jgi:hypothetical protein
MSEHQPGTSSGFRGPGARLVALVAGVGLCSAAVHGWLRARSLEERALAVEERLSRSEAANGEWYAELRLLRGDVEETAAELTSVEHRMEQAEGLYGRVLQAEDKLSNIEGAIASQANVLCEIEEAQASFGPDEVQREQRERDERLMRRWQALDELLNSVRLATDHDRERVDELSAPRDLVVMWRELVGPVVQLSGEESVGSGVLLHSQPDEVTGTYVTHILTAWHVVRDIQGESGDLERPVPVTIYGEDGSVRHESALLVCHDVQLDAALLSLRTAEPLPNGAALAPRDRLGSVRIFDEIYAVGCPLGNDPIPTRGEFATLRHRVDEATYWMINAPTYIGNSGGGIFDSRTHELLGIFSKIYTHGSMRPTIVPHMGLVTPLDAIYEWLDAQGYAWIEPDASGAGPRVATYPK